MSNANISGSKPQKFLFDANVFDAPKKKEQVIEEDLPPPPPVFSEQELEAARASAFEQGRQKAEAEGRASRAQRSNDLVQDILRNMTMLFAQERQREDIFEREAVNLCARVFEHVFPVYAQTAGFEELKASLREIIGTQKGTGMIRIYVQSTMAEDIEHVLQTLSEQNPDLNFTITPDDSLSAGACRLAWEYGGAVRDSDAVAMQIREILKEALAARVANRHDNQDNQRLSAPATGEKGDAHE